MPGCCVFVCASVAALRGQNSRVMVHWAGLNFKSAEAWFRKTAFDCLTEKFYLELVSFINTPVVIPMVTAVRTEAPSSITNYHN